MNCLYFIISKELTFRNSKKGSNFCKSVHLAQHHILASGGKGPGTLLNTPQLPGLPPTENDQAPRSTISRGRPCKKLHGKTQPHLGAPHPPVLWLICQCKASLWSLDLTSVLCTGVIPTSLPPEKLTVTIRTCGAHGFIGLGSHLHHPQGPQLKKAGPGTEWPWVPCLHISPCVHTSVVFTWCSWRLAHVLMLKIGTQPAFVGERKEGRKEGFRQRRQQPSHQWGGLEPGGVGGGEWQGTVLEIKVKVFRKGTVWPTPAVPGRLCLCDGFFFYCLSPNTKKTKQKN